MLRGECHVRSQILALQHACRVAAVQPLDLRQRRDQPFDLQRPISGGDNGKDIADVAELDLNAVFVPEQVVHLNACQTGVSCVNGQFCPVKRIKRIAVAKFVPVDIIPADAVDFFPCIVHILHCFPVHLPPVHRQIPPSNIQRYHEQIRRTRGLCQVDDLPYIVRIDALRTEQHGTLCQTAAGLVNADRCHICTGSHSGTGEILPEIEMCAMCFVCQQQHAVFMGKLRNAADIRTDTVVSRVVDQYSFCVRIGKNGTFHRFY